MSDIAYAREILQAEARAVEGLIPLLDENFNRAVEWILHCQGQVVVTGMGKSGLIGQKVSATLASTGTPSLSLHPAEAIHGDLGRVRPDDILLALSNGGETEEVIRLIPSIKKRGTKLISITGRVDSTLGRHSDLVLNIGRIDEACPLGLAPTASTTAMLALGDALAICVSKRRNFTPEDYALFHPGGSLGRKLMKVQEIMRTGDAHPIMPEQATVLEVIVAITRSRSGAATIVNAQGKIAGIFTDGDLRRKLRENPAITQLPVQEVMTRHPVTVLKNTLVAEVLRLLKEKKIDEVPVVDEELRPLGMVDVQDLLNVGV